MTQKCSWEKTEDKRKKANWQQGENYVKMEQDRQEGRNEREIGKKEGNNVQAGGK